MSGSSSGDGEGARSLKERALEELKVFWIIALYLWLFLGSFTAYRRLILAESGVSYVHYGFALVEALIIAKVVLLGRALGIGRRFDDGPLYRPVLYKSLLFGLLVMLFGIVEHLVEGWIHHKGLFDGLREIAAVGAYEIGARMLMLTVAFVPFFAFCELGRVLGMRRLADMFFASTKRMQ
jgi:fatty acid desaturase